MPVVGQGSCCGAYNISSWLAAGGLHIDTSVDYGSQPTIAAAIQASGVPRSALWITSKLNVESCALDMSADLQALVLAPLQMDYVDLLLLHHAGRWETDRNPHPPCFDASAAGPVGNGTYYQCRMDTVRAMEALVRAGKARTWGVSNWQVRDLQQMHDAYGFYPAINQIEHHPWWRESEVVSFCNKHGILVEAYAPMGDGDRTHMRDAPIFAQLAAQNNVTVGQLIMSYDLQVGADIVIPRSATPEHQVENLNLFGPGGAPVVTLSELDVAAISGNHTLSKACEWWLCGAGTLGGGGVCSVALVGAAAWGAITLTRPLCALQLLTHHLQHTHCTHTAQPWAHTAVLLSSDHTDCQPWC
jgi:diketogulonate reductase-like aldo/keto reductase